MCVSSFRGLNVVAPAHSTRRARAAMRREMLSAASARVKPKRRRCRRQKTRAASQVKPVNADHEGAPAAQAARRAEHRGRAASRRCSSPPASSWLVDSAPRRCVPDSSPTTPQRSSSERDSDSAPSHCVRADAGVEGAEPRRGGVDVAVPGAEVDAVDRVDAPVGLAAAGADAAARGRHRRAGFEPERVRVVDREASLDDDGGVAEAARAAAGVDRARPGIGADANAPVGRERELERDRHAVAALARAGVLVQHAGLDLEPSRRREGRRRRHARAIRHGGRLVVGARARQRCEPGEQGGDWQDRPPRGLRSFARPRVIRSSVRLA